jgi:hypothetical protein
MTPPPRLAAINPRFAFATASQSSASEISLFCAKRENGLFLKMRIRFLPVLLAR